MARYLRDRELQREINAGLNVAESWNAGHSVICSGKGGDIPQPAMSRSCRCCACGSCRRRATPRS